MVEYNCSFSIIIPAYNEAVTLEKSVLHTVNTFKQMGLDFEVIVVNDKSTDKTGEIADRLARNYPDILVAHHDENKGSGDRIKTGISQATKDYVMFVPVDNPLDVEDMEAYLPRVGVCDIVVGYRVERVGYSPFARFASFVYNRIMVPLFFNIGVNDVNWIQVYRRSLFTEGIIGYENSSLFWLVEILVNAKRKRLIIAEVPSRMKKRYHGRATCTRLSVITSTMMAMLKYFIRQQRKPQT